MAELQAALYQQDGQRLRERLERAIERLIALLDRIDGDADFEEQCEDEGAQSDAEPDDEEAGSRQHRATCAGCAHVGSRRRGEGA